jgi:peptide/nickel transport system permease protein
MQELRDKRTETPEAEDESYYVASQWQLMGRKFRQHKLAIAGLVVIALFYLVAIFAEFVAPYQSLTRHPQYIYCQPQRIRFIHEGRLHLRPFVYGFQRSRDPDTLRSVYTLDKSERYPIRLFVRGDSYKFWGLWETDLHLFGVGEEGVMFLFGTDLMGRDLFSQNIYGARISLSIGLVGVAVSFVLGCIIGGISGYYGGVVDAVIQRIIEFLLAIPTIPLWMALSAALPADWSYIRVYFFITIILAIRGWAYLARIVRGKFLELREEDFVMAARACGATSGMVIGRHLIPSFLSYLIVSLTLSIPRMILGETALSFLGLGLRPPIISWGVLLQEAQNIRTVALYPWLLIPSVFVIVAVLAFNFLGDGLRDAADPYK